MGEGRVIPGFEEAVTRMEPGDEVTVTIPAEQAYGPRRDELLIALDRTDFPQHIQPEVGQQLQLRQDDGEVAIVTIAEVSDSQVTIDINHPLAGEDLTFDLQLVEIRSRV